MMHEVLTKVYIHPLLQQQDAEKIYKGHTEVVFKKGDFILKENQVSTAYYVMASGLARSFVTDLEGNDITTNFFAEGEIAIEVLSLFQKIPSQENIQALTDCLCYKIDFDTFQLFFREVPGFSEWGRAWFTMSLFAMKQRSLSIIVDSAKDRYLNLIKEKPLVAQQAPLKYIATFLGIADTSLSRIRKELAQG
jgi:CRP/FNR family transcriptional regulator, anaerobic regulatory protein